MSQEILALRLFRKRGISPNIIRPSLMRQPVELPRQKYWPAAEHLCRAGSFARNRRRISSADFIRQNLCAAARDIVRYLMRVTAIARMRRLV